MSMKNVKKVGMGGFMCSIPDASAVCMMTGDNGSVIVPRRQMRTSSSCACSSSTLVDHSMVMKNSNTNYSRLVEPRRTSVSLGDRRPVTLSTALKRDRQCEREGERISCRPSRPLAPPPLPVFQKVVMRVSIHCQGCAGKLKKHLSKMEGVTSFSIDLETKRVTVMGHVSPVFVLESISKVKKAELWPC